MRDARVSFGQRFMAFSWLLIFAAYAGISFIWWAISPHGFPFTHPQTWSNTILPLFVCAICTCGIAGIILAKAAIAKSVSAFILGLTLSLSILSLIRFPISFGPSNGLRYLVFLTAIAGGCVLLLLATTLLFWSHRRLALSPALLVISSALSLGVGFGLVQTQQSHLASTIPLNQAIPADLQNRLVATDNIEQSLTFQGRTSIWPTQDTIQTQCGQLWLQINPLLTFVSRSPDRFWTLFAPPDSRLGPRRTLTESSISAARMSFSYVDDDRSWLDIQQEGPEVLKIDSYSRLPTSIYSHLNTFTRMTVDGGQKLSISFSAADNIPVEILDAGYPFGKPARMAFRDRDGKFLVVQASNAEKGPFQPLATGQLDRSEALEFTLYDNDIPQCSITLQDWAAQASTDLSPTAGWGFTQNSIGFQLLPAEANESSTGFIHISLADTSVGRGFNSVGHTAGTYRNRMRIQSLPSAQ